MKLGSIEDLYSIYCTHPSVVTDTRKLKSGDLYFALKGPNFNGNVFAIAALEAGAAYAIVDEAVADSDTYQERIILVQDVLTTLQQLAKYHRQQFDIPFIAITGSNGKTTTKELVYTVLASHFITYTTQGNLNNHIGVPLTLLSIHKDAEMAVIEMGANHQKEIESYCTYTLPTFGMITNCGKADLEEWKVSKKAKVNCMILYTQIMEQSLSWEIMTIYKPCLKASQIGLVMDSSMGKYKEKLLMRMAC